MAAGLACPVPPRRGRQRRRGRVRPGEDQRDVPGSPGPVEPTISSAATQAGHSLLWFCRLRERADGEISSSHVNDAATEANDVVSSDQPARIQGITALRLLSGLSAPLGLRLPLVSVPAAWVGRRAGRLSLRSRQPTGDQTWEPNSTRWGLRRDYPRDPCKRP